MQRLLFDGYRPHLQVDGGEYLGISFFDVAANEPETPFTAKARLSYWPEVDYTPLQAGVAFHVKEGAKTVGTGIVTEGWSN